MIRQSEIFLGVGLWGTAQTFLLWASASGAVLWFHQAVPAESMALSVMAGGQILLGSVLLPVIARGIWGLVINVALMLVFDLLAGALASDPAWMAVERFGLAGMWLLGLGLCWMLGNHSAKRAVCATAILYTAGGAMLDYLRVESAAGLDHSSDAISLILWVADAGKVGWVGWLEAGVPIALSVSMLLFSSVYRR